MKAIHVLVVGLALVLLVVGWVLAQGTPSIPWWVVGGGGGPATGSSGVALNDTLGQAIIGPATSGSISLEAGFWYGHSVQVSPKHEAYLPLLLRNP